MRNADRVRAAESVACAENLAIVTMPTPQGMTREMNEPEGTFPLPDCCPCVWRVQLDYWTTEFKIENAELAKTDKSLKDTKADLKDTSTRLMSTTAALEAKTMEANRLIVELKKVHHDLDDAVAHLNDTMLELSTTRKDLDTTKHHTAHSRWNLAAGVEKAEEIKKKLKVTADVRKQLLHQSEKEKHAIVEEVYRQKKAKLKVHEERLGNLTYMKEQIDKQLGAYMSLTEEEINGCRAELGMSEREQVIASTRKSQEDGTDIDSHKALKMNVDVDHSKDSEKAAKAITMMSPKGLKPSSSIEEVVVPTPAAEEVPVVPMAGAEPMAGEEPMVQADPV